MHVSTLDTPLTATSRMKIHAKNFTVFIFHVHTVAYLVSKFDGIQLTAREALKGVSHYKEHRIWTSGGQRGRE